MGCKVKLSKKEDEVEDNKEFKEKFPKFYDYFIPKIKLEEADKIETPVDIPEEAVKKLSIGKRFIEWMGIILLTIATALIVGVHVLPTFCLTMCVAIPVFMCADADEDVALLITLLISFFGLIVTPFIIVYIVLLGEMDAWDEIQSWMIAYIAWGICSYFLFASFIFGFLLQETGARDAGLKLTTVSAGVVFWLLGIDFGSISVKELFNSDRQTFAYLVLFLFQQRLLDLLRILYWR